MRLALLDCTAMSTTSTPSQPLVAKRCAPCSGGVPALTEAEYHPLLLQLTEWSVVGGHHIIRRFKFPDFISGLQFVNQVGTIAEAEGHHPDILLRWGSVEITIWTHKIDGLTESDFVLAAKIDNLVNNKT